MAKFNLCTYDIAALSELRYQLINARYLVPYATIEEDGKRILTITSSAWLWAVENLPFPLTGQFEILRSKNYG